MIFIPYYVSHCEKAVRVMAPFQHGAYAKIQRSFIFLKNEMRMELKMLCFAYTSNIPLINRSNYIASL